MRGAPNQLDPELAIILPQLSRPPLVRFRRSEFVMIPMDDEDV